MMRQTIFENRKRQTSFLAFVFVLKEANLLPFLLLEGIHRNPFFILNGKQKALYKGLVYLGDYTSNS